MEGVLTGYILQIMWSVFRNNRSSSEIGYISVLIYPISKHQMELVKIARDSKEKAIPIAYMVLTKLTISNTHSYPPISHSW